MKEGKAMSKSNSFYSGNKTKYPVKIAAAKYEYGQHITVYFENYITGEKKTKTYKTIAAAKRATTIFFKNVNVNETVKAIEKELVKNAAERIEKA